MKTFLTAAGFALLLFTGLTVSAQTPILFNPGDIAVINNIIENNGLNRTKAVPADGSFVPENWTRFTLPAGYGATGNHNTFIDNTNQSVL